MDQEIAKTLISQMDRQIDQLVTLAVAICGGIFAMLLQVGMRNVDTSKPPVRLDWLRLIVVCLILEGVSVLMGYAARGSMTSRTAVIFYEAQVGIENWTEVDFPGHSQIKFFAVTQLLAFLGGLALLLTFAIRNLALLKAPNPPNPANSQNKE